MATLTIRDQTLSGGTTNELTLDVLTETITVRELIRGRVYQEVQDFNRKLQAGAADAFKGLVTPTDEERILKQPGTKTRKPIDWNVQFKVACDAFERNGFFILVDERQAEALDETITLRHDTRVSFVRLTPLVGG